ncbi:MAG: MFS transporter [Actinomycetota bacterium]
MASRPLRGGLRDVRDLLLYNPRFPRLLGTQLLSQAADGLYQIALASVLIFGLEAASTPAQVTKVLAVTYVPFSLVGPLTGPFIDRFSRRSILVGAGIVRATLTILMIPATGWGEGWLLGLAVATVSVNRFFHSTKNAVLPTLVETDQYLLANAISSTSGMVVALAGAVIGGPLTEVFSPRVPIAVATVCTIASAAIATTLRLARGEKRGLAGVASEIRENLRDVADGLRVLQRTPRATYGVFSTWTTRGLHGFILLAALVVGRSRFDIGPGGFSLVLALAALGGFVGAVLVPLVARRVGRTAVAPWSFAVAGAATMVGGPAPAWPALLAAVAIAGGAMQATKIASETMIQRGIPDRYRGRAFAVYDLGYNGVFVLAALVATLARPALRDLGIIFLTAFLYFAGSALLVAWRRRLLAEIEVRAYAGGRADEAPREVVWDGIPIDVAETERSWHEERDGRRLLCFRLRLADGRRIEISRDGEWRLDRVLVKGAGSPSGGG